MQEPTKQSLWPMRLQAQAESGRTIRAWCADNGVTEATFHYWRNRLATIAAPAPQFIALPSTCQSVPMLEVATPNGFTVRLGSAAHVDWLGAVLAVLR